MPGTKRIKRVVVAVAAVVAVVVGWWWLHGKDPEVAPAQAARSEPSEPRQPRERSGRNGEVDLGSRVVLDDDPRGALRLEGQVVDADDHGVAGATVVLAANPVRTTTTEADGGFAFDGLIGRRYTLIARAPGGAAGPVTVRLTDKSDPVILKLHPAAKLTVSVVGRDGQPINGATVELRGIDDQRQLTKAGSAVFSPVVAGNYQIAAWADGLAKTFQRILIGHGDAQARLILAPGAAVSGRVVDDRGAGVAGARVRYGGASDWTQQASDRHDAAVTAADGSFHFAALPAGSFRFTASHPERSPATSALTTLDGKTPHDGVVITMAIGAIVRGRVVDAQNHPVGSARVRIGAAGGPGGFGGPGGGGGGFGRGGEPPRQAYSNADGAFEIQGLPRKPLHAAALHELGSSQTVAVDTTGGNVEGLVLTLDVTGTISGIVVDPDGQPVEGAQVTAGPGGGGFGGFAGLGGGSGGPGGGSDFAGIRLRGIPQETTDAGGKFTLTGLAPGQYRLTAVPAQSRGRGRGFRDGVAAKTGDRDVKLVIAPDGSVKGRVAFAEGGVPDLFSVSAQQVSQSFGSGDGSFVLEGLAPATYQLEIRGPSFESAVVSVTISSSKVADVGTINVARGRSVGGVVLSAGQPVANATVYAGQMIIGNGTTSSAQPAGGALAGAFGNGTKTATTDSGGGFTISGLAPGDLTVLAEQDAIGRSKAMRLPGNAPGQTELTINLEAFGALSGTLRGARQPDGIVVTCQSTTSPGAVFTVPAGADGSYRFDRLAPDTYKVSATIQLPRIGARFYSQQVVVPAGAAVTADLTVDAGSVTLTVAIATRAGGVIGNGSAWLTSGSVTATTMADLRLKMAAAGAGTSGRTGIINGQPVQFTQLVPGPYSVCIVPLPLEITGINSFNYINAHADTLPAFCQAVTVQPAPDAQSASVAVDLPAVVH